MSSSRIDLLKNYIERAQRLACASDEKTLSKVKNIFLALGRYEYYHVGSTGITNLIGKLEVPNLQKTLESIHQLLSAEVADKGDIFQSGNVFWNEIVSFDANHPTQGAISDKDAQLIAAVKKIEIAVKDVSSNMLEGASLSELLTWLIELETSLIIGGLNACDLLCAKISSDQLRTQQEREKDKLRKDALVYAMHALLATLKVYKHFSHIALEDSRAKFKVLHAFYLLCSAEINKVENDDYRSDLKIVLHTVTTHFANLNPLSTDVECFSVPSDDAALQISKDRPGVAAVNVDYHDFSRRGDKVASFQGRILPEHAMLGTANFTASPHHEEKSLHTLLASCLFDDAVMMCMSIPQVVAPEAFQSKKSVLPLYVTLVMIPHVLGVWSRDQFPLRAFSFIRFLNEKLTAIKKIDFNKLDDNQKLSFQSAFEDVWATLIRMTMKDIPEEVVSSPDYFSQHIQYPQVYADYYHLVEKQQYLFMLAEIITMFPLFKMDIIQKDSVRQLMLKHFNQSNFEGLFDLLLRDIKVIEDQLIATTLYQPSYPLVVQQDPMLAEQNMQELLKQLDAEQEALAKVAAQQLGENKKRYRDGIKKGRKALSHLFKEKASVTIATSSESKAKELSREQELYLQAGRLRQTSDIVSEAAINKYLEVVSYKNPESSDKIDYFYIAASFAELADCYNRKADEKIPLSYASGEFNFDRVIAEEYAKSLEFAQSAYRCFVENVESRVESYSSQELKDFHDLAKHVRFILKSTEDKLRSFEKFCEDGHRHLQESQARLQAGRMAAMRRFTREEWLNRPNPSNYYSNLYKSNQEKLKNLSQSQQDLHNYIANRLQPVGVKFAYLVGGVAAPFQLKASEEENCDAALQGRSDFATRLRMAATNERLLKSPDANVSNVTREEPRRLLRA